jgi:UDPglucose 6-dehydrogenase
MAAETRIAVIGCGHVGLVTAACFAEIGHRVLGVDSDKRKVALLRSGGCPIYEPGLVELLRRVRAKRRLTFSNSIAEAVRTCDVLFLCLPTPPLPDGRSDLSYIESVSREIARHLRGYRLVVEKSTVPVQTCERVRATIQKYAPAGADFDVASNPEFLREGRAIEDTLRPDRIVIGVESRRAEQILRRIYAPIRAPIISTDVRSAEMIKHAANSFLALKISYANALAAVCEAAGADIRDVVRGMGSDRRIGAEFLNAGIGYGGSCFPKDVRAFDAISAELGAPIPFLRQIEQVNQWARERFVQKVERELWIVRGKRIGAWGLAFKPDTDDVRESVAIEVIRALAERGARVCAYDPKSIPNARAALRGVRGVSFARSALDAARRADCLVILTEWKEFLRVPLARLRAVMAHPTVLDGRNLLDPEEVRKAGFVYRGVGIP